jgi:hypothetical protein
MPYESPATPETSQISRMAGSAAAKMEESAIVVVSQGVAKRAKMNEMQGWLNWLRYLLEWIVQCWP